MAADELYNNLKDLRAANPNADWPTICCIAYFSRLRLTAQSFAKLPDEIQWDWATHTGCSGYYTSYGLGMAITEVNLTGEFKVLEMYIQKDVGSPLNPLVDCGQIEGGFVQGMGLLTTEEIIWEKEYNGTVTKKYAYPSITDTPQYCDTEIQKDVPNPANIYDSKASAESPTCLGSAVFFSVKNAIKEFNYENAVDNLGNKYLKCTAPLSYRKIFEYISGEKVPDVDGGNE